MTPPGEIPHTEIEALKQRVADLEAELEHYKLYRMIFEQMPVATVIYTPDGLTYDVNPQNEAIFGIPREGVVGNYNVLNDPEASAKGFTDYFDQARQGAIAVMPPTAFNVANTRLEDRGNEREVWTEATFFPLCDETGEVKFIAETYIDISRRVHAEQDLRMFKSLVENAADGIGVATLDGKLAYANTSYHRMLQYDEVIIGQQVTTFYNEPDEKMQKLINQVSQEGHWQGVLSYKRKDGSTFPGMMSAFSILDEQGTVRAVAGIIRDMTGQLNMERELRTFQTLVENAADGINVTTLDGHIHYANAFFRHMTGLGDAVVGTSVVDLYHEDPDQLMQVAQHVTETGSWRGEFTLKPADGSAMPITATVFSINDEQGQAQALAAIIRDISELKRQEQERLVLQEQVIEAQRAALRELSSPLIPIADNVVIMPLIGSIDSGRAQQVMETLLEGVAEHNAETAILDITGVQVVDTQVANALIQAAQAVRLLGAQVVLTGIGPSMAQTLVGLGADLSSIVTQGSLQSGIAYALDKAPLAGKAEHMPSHPVSVLM